MIPVFVFFVFQTSPSSAAPVSVVFTLPNRSDLTHIQVWNYNDLNGNNYMRAAHRVIFYGRPNDRAQWTQLSNEVELPRAPVPSRSATSVRFFGTLYKFKNVKTTAPAALRSAASVTITMDWKR